MKNNRLHTALLLVLTAITTSSGLSYAQALQRPVNLDFEGSEFHAGRVRDGLCLKVSRISK